LEPIALALIVAILILWCLLPGGFKKDSLDEVDLKKNAESQPQDMGIVGATKEPQLDV
jgi:hypothetical protein